MSNQLKITLLLFCCLFSVSGWAQFAEVRGTVIEKGKAEPVFYAKVLLSGTDKATIADVNGIFALTHISPGKYELICTAIGYDTFRTSVTLAAEQKLKLSISLKTLEKTLQEVTVTHDRTQKENNVEISKLEITPRQMQIVPSIGGEADVAQYLQVLPGVIFTGDQGGQLYIRGGEPIQNKVLLDGMTIFNPFHSIGLFSVFDVDAIRSMDVYTGGFNAGYGGRLSAVMDITTRDGDKSNFGGKISMSPFTSKLLLEGPIKKFSETGNSMSFLFTSRGSYLEQTSKLLYPYAGSQGLPYNFLDLYGKATLAAAQGSKISLFGFNYMDQVNFPNSTHYNWEQWGGGAKFILLPEQSSAVIDGNVDVSGYSANQKDADAQPRYSDISEYLAGLNFTYYFSHDQFKYGFQLEGTSTNFSFYNSANRNIVQSQSTTEISGYMRYNKVLNRLVLDPSLRLEYYASQEEFSLEPRLALKYNITERFRLKGAWGIFSQNLLSAQSNRDVVNLFYGFLSSPDNLPSTFNGQPVTSHLQHAVHYVAGTEYDILKNISLQVEGYYKDFNELINLNPNKLFESSDFSKPESQRLDFIIESGKAYGADFLLSYDKSPYYFWLTYSLMKVTRFNGSQEYPPFWDRRNTINLVGAYKWGKDKSWEASVRWTYGSGFPFTKTAGYYDLIDFQQQGISTNIMTANGKVGTLYDTLLNSGRMPDYHRLDASVKKKYHLKRQKELEIIGSVTNIYNRENIFYVERVSNRRVNQLPILPSLALNLTF